MNTRYATPLLITAIICAAMLLAFADRSSAPAASAPERQSGYSGDLNISYNKRPIAFSSEPQVLEQEVYVPISELATALGLYVKLESDRYILLYKNNTFVKMDLENTQIAINGKPYDVNIGPFYSDQRILAPLLFLAEAFHYETVWDKGTGALEISDGNLSSQFDFTESNNFYKRIDVADLGIRISIPVHWEALDEKKRLYGYIDDFESFSLELSQMRVDSSDSLAKIEKDFEQTMKKRDGDRLKITQVDKVTATRLDSYAIFSDYAKGKEAYKQVTYLFKDRRNAYVLHFKYADYMDGHQAGAIIGTIADSFQINQLTIQERDEHYIEFPHFFRLGMNLDEPIYANQTTHDYFVLKGSVKSDTDGFNVKVAKGTQAISFYVPIKSRRFEQKIYLPFGLGKHDVYIEEADNGGLFSKKSGAISFEPVITYDETNVMQFSILNISNSSIRYLIPSSRVPSDLEKMSSLGKLLTYKEETSYKKAKAVYHWIEQNIQFELSDSEEVLRSPVEVFDASMATEEEMAYFYATVLRSIDIPCKIVTGDYNGDNHFWNELFINGKWIVADLGEEFTNGDGITAYYNLSRDEHYSEYTNIKVLDY